MVVGSSPTSPSFLKYKNSNMKAQARKRTREIENAFFECRFLFFFVFCIILFYKIIEVWK